MMLCLLFISPRSIGNSFFKFASLTAAILLGVVLGFNFLFPSPVRLGQMPVILLAVSALLMAIYNRVVDVDKFTAANVLLAGVIVTGLLSIVWDSFAFTKLMVLGGWERWVLMANHLSATGLMGSVMLTMVFGHWYLVIPRLSIDPLVRLTKVMIVTIGFRILTIALSLFVLQAEQSIPLSNILNELLFRQAFFFWPRVIFGVIIPIVLAVMIWTTVQLKHTQAATGLLYLGVVAVLFGEFFSKFLLFSVNLPL